MWHPPRERKTAVMRKEKPVRTNPLSQTNDKMIMIIMILVMK
jgi:hypothetical protein